MNNGFLTIMAYWEFAFSLMRLNSQFGYTVYFFYYSVLLFFECWITILDGLQTYRMSFCSQMEAKGVMGSSTSNTLLIIFLFFSAMEDQWL
jgi:hypothetical protein